MWRRRCRRSGCTQRAAARGPDGFTVDPKLLRQLERRRETLESGGIDWGQAEALAFVAARGRDPDPPHRSGHGARDVLPSPPRAARARTGETATPIQSLPGANASFEVYNSPLSEFAALGFEYGYSVAASDALVLWEAQFGDFVNGAQVVIDQFMVAGRSKWNQTSRLTLLLPHGYEGNGPEHSSARLERFLQLGAQDNIRVANCTTAAQFFHLLRRQALDAVARPLVVMTPKGLLRLKQASSTVELLGGGRFEAVLDDPTAAHDAVGSSCSAREALLRHRRARPARDGGACGGRAAGAALSVPGGGGGNAPARYPRLREVVWAQEEPQNMGPWRSIRHRLEQTVRTSTAETVHYVGRTWKASPSEGYPTAHQLASRIASSGSRSGRPEGLSGPRRPGAADPPGYTAAWPSTVPTPTAENQWR